MTVTPFQIRVSEEILGDLRLRLGRTLFTGASDSACWRAGTDPGYLRGLVGYWANGFDWRAAESALNTYPQFTAEVAGRRVHFIHLRGQGDEGAPAVMPLVLTHGWPSSFVEMLQVARQLADPASHGGDPADAFDVVIPSLPGFMYSELPDGPFTHKRVAGIWHELMTQTLGYPRFGAFGGDIGGQVTQWLGALADSPAGLAAWIIDKYRDWSDCAGDLESRWDKDTLLTVATLYWVTGSIGTSFRQYHNYSLNEPVPDISVPAAITLSNEPAYANYVRSLAERRCTDLRHWSTPLRGGHFMAYEEPEQVASELRNFFRPLRPAQAEE
jgi:pimeloyl-ACP methyl ester carboxylesterase